MEASFLLVCKRKLNIKSHQYESIAYFNKFARLFLDLRLKGPLLNFFILSYSIKIPSILKCLCSCSINIDKIYQECDSGNMWFIVAYWICMLFSGSYYTVKGFIWALSQNCCPCVFPGEDWAYWGYFCIPIFMI